MDGWKEEVLTASYAWPITVQAAKVAVVVSHRRKRQNVLSGPLRDAVSGSITTAASLLLSNAFWRFVDCVWEPFPVQIFANRSPLDSHVRQAIKANRHPPSLYNRGSANAEKKKKKKKRKEKTKKMLTLTCKENPLPAPTPHERPKLRPHPFTPHPSPSVTSPKENTLKGLLELIDSNCCVTVTSSVSCFVTQSLKVGQVLRVRIRNL